jgi:hypothetical protein
MTFPTVSFVNGFHLAGMMSNTLAYNLSTGSNSTHNVSLYTSAMGTPNKDANETHGASPWNANEVVYTGASPASAKTLTTPIIAQSAGKITFKDNTASTCAWTNATWTAWGCGIWDAGLTNPVYCGLYFNQVNGVPVVGGTFTITWDSGNGIFYATY